MQKGDIFTAKDRVANPHPIIFLEQKNDEEFIACIISSKPIGKNIPMSLEHFLVNDESGNPYEIQFNNSHLVPDVQFIKLYDWVNTNKVKGRLTDSGISFIEHHLTGPTVLFPHPIKDYHP